jgi:hypothetical protein
VEERKIAARRVCKIALRGAATRHCINGDFAHAVGLSDR